MKFTKKMVEVIERQIGRKFTADEIERGAVKETVKTWSSSKVVSIRRGMDKKLHIEGQFVGDSYVYQRATFNAPDKKFEQAVRA